MSGRQYFDLRYAIPGFSFSLLIVGINYVPLLKLLEPGNASEILVVFLAFLSLFSGSAIGFLISQVWWFRWQCKGGILGVNEYKKSLNRFESKFGIKKPLESNEEEWINFHTAVNYVVHSVDNEKILIMAERRWDLYHILSTTFHTLWLGVTIGLLLRLYFQSVLFKVFSHFQIL